MKTGTGSAIRCIYASAEALLVAVPVPLFISPACGWADENGDWLRNILYLSKSTTAISCGACPPFHQTSLRVAQLPGQSLGTSVVSTALPMRAQPAEAR